MRLVHDDRRVEGDGMSRYTYTIEYNEYRDRYRGVIRYVNDWGNAYKVTEEQSNIGDAAAAAENIIDRLENDHWVEMTEEVYHE